MRARDSISHSVGQSFGLSVGPSLKAWSTRLMATGLVLFSLPDQSLRLPWDRSNGLVKRVWRRFKFRLWQHNFHHPNHVKENVAMFGVFWVVSGH